MGPLRGEFQDRIATVHVGVRVGPLRKGSSSLLTTAESLLLCVASSQL